MMSLDQLISQQFGKVTKLANNKLGWNKYDLALPCVQISSASAAISGMYTFVQAAANPLSASPATDMASGLIISGMGLYIYKGAPTKIHELEKRETANIANAGATYLSEFEIFKRFRPLTLGAAVGTFFSALANYFLVSMDNADSSTAYDLSAIAAGSAATFGIFTSYFLEQPMAPPTKKKNPLKTLYQKLTHTLPPYAEPATIPVSK